MPVEKYIALLNTASLGKKYYFSIKREQ